MKKLAILTAAMLLVLSGCNTQMSSSAATQAAFSQKEGAAVIELSEQESMRLMIGEKEVPVTWEENGSVEALKALSPITIQMSMYGGFEQVGPIGQSIVREDAQTDASYGDIVLYSGNQIVIFYGSNSWAYTRLGHIDLSQQEMRALLGGGDVAITLCSARSGSSVKR